MITNSVWNVIISRGYQHFHSTSLMTLKLLGYVVGLASTRLLNWRSESKENREQCWWRLSSKHLGIKSGGWITSSFKPHVAALVGKHKYKRRQLSFGASWNKKKTFSREAGKLHLQMRKKKLRVTEKISYKMHPVMLDVYNFYEILSIGDWKKIWLQKNL